MQVTLTTSPADLERKLDDDVSAWLRDAEVRPDDIALREWVKEALDLEEALARAA